MDRKQAQAIVGKIVIIDEGQEGRYAGVLQEVIAPPRKTWRGKVQIQAVDVLPSFRETESKLELQPLKYTANEVIECIGSKLLFVEEQMSLSFQESLKDATKRRWNELQEQLDKSLSEQHALTSFLAEQGLEFNEEDHHILDHSQDIELKNDHFISYTFHKKNEHFLLVDEQNEALELEDCPFEFQWTHNERSFVGYYEKDGTFVSEDGVRYSPSEGDTFTIDKKQFDPYFILRNELEPAALESLEKSLQSHELTHVNIVDCHNALLGQLLNADGKEEFHGVNFLTYRGKQGLVMVQHHFDRKLHDESNDEIYDRFEFTTEQGKRSIVTYTNEFSR